MKNMITRIAPSPSGNLHIGTARTAYFNWLAAKSTGGKFLLRIDDTDSKRSDDNYIKSIVDSLDWLGMDYTDMFYSHKRTNIYKDYLDRIDPKYLRKDGDAIRLNLSPTNIMDSWKDNLVRKPIKTSNNDRDIIKNMVIWKSDGSPTYHFASVVDDIDMGVNTIIRGSDHLGNTNKHIVLYNLLNADIPDFYHVGLIHNMDGKKISKRDGATSITDYRDLGYSKDAILNFILRLGWSPRDPNMNGKVDVDMAIDMFWKSGKMKNSSCKMDINKLNWYNKIY